MLAALAAASLGCNSAVAATAVPATSMPSPTPEAIESVEVLTEHDPSAPDERVYMMRRHQEEGCGYGPKH